MSLIDFIKLRNNGIDKLCKLQDEKMAVYERIIEDCRSNDNKRELLHFLNVYCDDIITVNKQIIESNFSLDSIEAKSYLNKYETLYKSIAMNFIEEMEAIIRQNPNNASLYFYILYMAYYSKIFDNRQNECYYFYMFERCKININYFNNQTQILYRSIKEDIDSFRQNS